MTEKTVNRIPKLNEFRVPADPGDPKSRDEFMPYSFKLHYKGQGGFNLAHRGTGESLELVNAEIVFLYVSDTTECQCKKVADKADMKARSICRTTDNRKLSFKGYLCSSECPYSEPGVDKENKLYSRPLSKMVILLVKHPTSKSFVIARYYGPLDRVKEYQTLQQRFKVLLPTKNPAAPYPTANVASITATVLEMKKGTSGRFGRIDWIEGLSQEETASVAELIKDITEMYRIKLDNDQAYCQSVRKEREEREKLTGVKEDPTADSAVETVTGAATEAASGTTPVNLPPEGNVAVSELTSEEDDLPF